MDGRFRRTVVVSAILAVLMFAFSPPVQASSNREHGSRHKPVSVNRLAVGLQQAAAPSAQEGNFDGGGQLRRNVNGVSSLDSEVTNFGAMFEPPDQGLCVGNGYVVEMVNSAFRIYDTSGKTLLGPTNVNAPFHEDFLAFTSDPRCHYDAATNTWFATILFINDASDASTLDIAYNTSGNPTTDWSVFRIDTTHAGAPARFDCPCFGDQPRLGIDASNIYVSTDEFSILGPEYNGAQLYAISKRDLVNHSSSVHFVHYEDVRADGAQLFAIEPAVTYGSAAAEYFLSALDPDNTGDHRVAVFALTDVGRVSSGGRPKLSSVIVNTEPYANPPQADQKGSSSQLDSGDDRMQQTQFIGGDIWGELTTAVTPDGDSAPRAGAAWFRIHPDLVGSKLHGATLVGQGYVASRGKHVIYPALQVDGQGHGAMVFTLVGSSMYPSAAFATMNENGTAFGRPRVAAEGSGPYNATPQRWGDYSYAVLDPSLHSVWLATEYMPPKSSQTSTGRRPWGTRVLQVLLG